MKINKVLVATRNKGKIQEYKEFFEELPIEFVSLDDVGITDESPEDGDTLEANARQKVEFYGKKANIMTIADDTGFFVYALDEKPGVHAKRFGDTPEERRAKILQMLEEVDPEKENRGAYFKLVIALYNPKNEQVVFFDGRIDGHVAESVVEGGHGFDYDLIFYYPPARKTFSQMSSIEKGEVSHRGKAFRKLKNYLEG